MISKQFFSINETDESRTELRMNNLALKERQFWRFISIFLYQITKRDNLITKQFLPQNYSSEFLLWSCDSIWSCCHHVVHCTTHKAPKCAITPTNERWLCWYVINIIQCLQSTWKKRINFCLSACRLHVKITLLIRSDNNSSGYGNADENVLFCKQSK